MSNSSTDKIIIRDALFLAKIGAFPGETASLQRIHVDTEIWFDLRKSAQSGQLKDTICWHTVNDLFKKSIESRTWTLAEEVSNKLCEIVLEHFGIAQKVKVLVKKFALSNAEWVGAEITRTR